MAKYSPKCGDIVFIDGKGFVRHLVVAVDTEKKTVDVRGVSGVVVLDRDIEWSHLQRLDESQNALRIVQEATEDK